MVMRGWVAWVVVVASGAGLAGGCTFQDDSCADGFRCARIPDGSSSSSDGDSQASDSGASSDRLHPAAASRQTTPMVEFLVFTRG